MDSAVECAWGEPERDVTSRVCDGFASSVWREKVERDCSTATCNSCICNETAKEVLPAYPVTMEH
jgi:hypothetical protein